MHLPPAFFPVPAVRHTNGGRGSGARPEAGPGARPEPTWSQSIGIRVGIFQNSSQHHSEFWPDVLGVPPEI